MGFKQVWHWLYVASYLTLTVSFLWFCSALCWSYHC